MTKQERDAAFDWWNDLRMEQAKIYLKETFPATFIAFVSEQQIFTMYKKYVLHDKTGLSSDILKNF